MTNEEKAEAFQSINGNSRPEPPPRLQYRHEEVRKEPEIPRRESPALRREPARARGPRSDNRNSGRTENLMNAILSLVKELDENELELLKRDIDRKIGSRV